MKIAGTLLLIIFFHSVSAPALACGAGDADASDTVTQTVLEVKYDKILKKVVKNTIKVKRKRPSLSKRFYFKMREAIVAYMKSKRSKNKRNIRRVKKRSALLGKRG